MDHASEWPTREQLFEQRQEDIKQNHELASHPHVNVLVPDVLREIFTHAMLADDEDYTLENWNKTSPNNVAAVCRRWRTIALESPRLWSAFRIFESYRFNQNLLATVLNTFLSRAGQVRLDITIDKIFEDSAPYVAMSELLVSRQAQFRKIHISFGFLNWAFINPPVLMDLSAAEDLRLEYLHIRSPAHLNLSTMLKLRILRLNGRFSLDLPREPILRNLVHVELATTNEWVPRGSEVFFCAHDCLAILASCPSIEIFSVKGIVDVESLTSRGTRFTLLDLPNLSTLRIIEVGPPVAQCILGKLRVTGLKELELRYTEPCREACGLTSLLLRSKPRLQCFSFDGLHISDIVACLESSPDLRHLTICDYSEGLWELDELLDRLTFTVDTRLCPRIEHIVFQYFHDGLGLSGIEAVIISRWECLPPVEERSLRTVTFDECLEISSSSFDYVSWPWLKGGPKVSIIVDGEEL